MRVLIVIVAVFLVAGTAAAAEKRVILFLDGARVEESHSAKGGYLEIPLPAGLKPGSLRLAPRAATRIERVETVPARLPLQVERELARLIERRERLQARLQALKTREGIFTAAAKAQSGKAPRKTKSNPEPLQNIRKGTDFALAQLEEVYSVRRSVEKELAAADAIQAQIMFTHDYQDIGLQPPQWQDLRKVIVSGCTGISLGGIDISIDINGVEIYADRLLEKVFFHLVDNAIKYGERIRRIHFFSEESFEELLIVCEDDGVGVAGERKILHG